MDIIGSTRGSMLSWALLLIMQIGIWCGNHRVASLQTGNMTCTATIEKSNSTLCLWLVKGLKTWTEADDECEMHGGYLVAVTSPEVQDVVTEIMKNNSIINLWLGLEEVMSTWRWLSNQQEVFHQGCFKENPDPDAVQVDTTVFTLNNSNAACNEVCRSSGKKYSKLQTAEKCACVDEFGSHGYGDCNLLCDDRVEICGGDRDGQSSIVNAVEGVYSDWERGQPNNHQFYQTCAVMDNYNDYEWNDIKCTEQTGVICELSLDESACTKGDFQYSIIWGCYVVSNFSMTFFDGLIYCQERGGQLLELTSVEKRNFYVNDVLLKDTYEPRSFYIGLVRGRWVWNTGERLVYSSFGTGWPNGKDQNCAITDQRGRWNDVTCSAPYSFICQKGKNPRTTPPPTTTPTTTTPTTTTTTTTPRTLEPCGLRCENHLRLYKQKQDREKQRLYYILIGGGAFLVVIMIICTVGTVFCIRKHNKKKKEKRFDYFFGVDVSRPEDHKEFKPREDTMEKKRISSSMTPDIVPVVHTNHVVAPHNNDITIQPVSSHNGTLDKQYIAQAASDSLVLDSAASTSTRGEKQKMVDTSMASEYGPDTSESPSNPDGSSNASTMRIDEPDDKKLMPGSSTDMTKYDYSNPDPSHLMF